MEASDEQYPQEAGCWTVIGIGGGCRHCPEELKGKPMPPLAGELSAKGMSNLIPYLKTL
jgi:hypothetical protein